MKLRPTHFRLIPVVILLGIIMSHPLSATGNDYDFTEDDQEQGYGVNDAYNSQIELQKTFQPVYNETEAGEEEYQETDEEEYPSEDEDMIYETSEEE